ncbi:MAG TPA: M17 family peptidase N-terminal domain-containing protein, partial [Pirellulaceae bacterium]
MSHRWLDSPVTQVRCDALVVGVFRDDPLQGAAADINGASDGLLARMIEAQEFTPKLAQTVLCFELKGVAAPLVAFVGLGARGEWSTTSCFRAAGAAARAVSDRARAGVAFWIHDPADAVQAEALVAGAMVGCVGTDLYRDTKSRHPIGEFLWPAS